MATSTRAAIRNLRRSSVTGIVVVGLLCLGIMVLLWWRGAEFYALSLDARVDHDDYRVLSPGSTVGHGYGIFGTLLILTNLLYLPRRRWPRLPLGSVKKWLDLHVVTGLVGGILILYHSAFQLRTPIATVTSGSLFLVIVTGVIGRYLYALSPKVDKELLSVTLEGVNTFFPGFGDSLGEVFRELPVPDLTKQSSLFSALTGMFGWLRAASVRKRAVMNVAPPSGFAEMDSVDRKNLKTLHKRVAKLAAAEVHTVGAQNLLRTWRGLHRLLAILMILSVTVHIAVAWYYGYRWLLSE